MVEWLNRPPLLLETEFVRSVIEAIVGLRLVPDDSSDTMISPGLTLIELSCCDFQ